MSATLCLLAALALQSAQSDEEKAIETFKVYIKALKVSDYERATDQMHPKSIVKIKERILTSAEKAPDAVRQNLARKLGFADWTALEKATPRAFFVAYLSNLKEMGEGGQQAVASIEGADVTIVGALKRDDKVFVIADTTFTVGKETHVAPALHVLYKDGEHWKMSHRGETNIGR
jgi:hypothetical protein